MVGSGNPDIKEKRIFALLWNTNRKKGGNLKKLFDTGTKIPWNVCIIKQKHVHRPDLHRGRYHSPWWSWCWLSPPPSILKQAQKQLNKIANNSNTPTQGSGSGSAFIFSPGQCCGAAPFLGSSGAWWPRSRCRLRPTLVGSSSRQKEVAPAPYTKIFHFKLLNRYLLRQVCFGPYLPF